MIRLKNYSVGLHFSPNQGYVGFSSARSASMSQVPQLVRLQRWSSSEPCFYINACEGQHSSYALQGSNYQSNVKLMNEGLDPRPAQKVGTGLRGLTYQASSSNKPAKHQITVTEHNSC